MLNLKHRKGKHEKMHTISTASSSFLFMLVFNYIAVQEYMTAEYKIWNIHGDILTSNIPISVGQT